MHEIKKQNIFSFLKAENIIIEETKSIIEIEETQATGTQLQKVVINSLNSNSKYWILNPENNTFLESKKKKVERIIIEETQTGILNIILLEMKSSLPACTLTGGLALRCQIDIEDKFKQSLHWVYLLLNLLNDKENKKIYIYGILVCQVNNFNWNITDNLNIFTSTCIRYKKKSFYTSENICTISYNSLIA